MSAPLKSVTPLSRVLVPAEPNRAGPPVLTVEQKRHLEDFGFLALEKITSPEDVAALRAEVASLFAIKAGFREGAQFNIVGVEDEEEDDALNILQILKPHRYAKVLRETEFYANALAVARQILGPEARYSYDHALLKPAGNGPATPWHQDEAYHDPRFNYSEVHFWLPLQAVDQLNGCMEFIAGTHRGEVLPHRPLQNDPRIHALECCGDFDPKDAVACPLTAGDCTIHLERTLHATGPNRSEVPRLSYVLVFDVPHRQATHPRTFPWRQRKNTAQMKREREWELRDGRMIAFWRKLKKKISNFCGRFSR